jgi:hypothetical protein
MSVVEPFQYVNSLHLHTQVGNHCVNRLHWWRHRIQTDRLPQEFMTMARKEISVQLPAFFSDNTTAVLLNNMLQMKETYVARC